MNNGRKNQSANSFELMDSLVISIKSKIDLPLDAKRQLIHDLRASLVACVLTAEEIELGIGANPTPRQSLKIKQLHSHISLVKSAIDAFCLALNESESI